MNKAILLFTVTCLPLTLSAQSWEGSTPGNIYYNQGRVSIGGSNPVSTLDLRGTFYQETNHDAVMTFNNSDNSWQYFQFKQSGERKAWMGLHANGAFYISKEKGGNIILSGANVGIGTHSPSSKLAVNGQIRATEVKVLQNIDVPDYVFEPDYGLRTLKETKEYILENKHLPEIPSAKEIGENGIDLGDMSMRLLKKIEELTLYQIELMEKLEQQDAELQDLKIKLQALSSVKQ